MSVWVGKPHTCILDSMESIEQPEQRSRKADRIFKDNSNRFSDKQLQHTKIRQCVCVCMCFMQIVNPSLTRQMNGDTFCLELRLLLYRKTTKQLVNSKIPLHGYFVKWICLHRNTRHAAHKICARVCIRIHSYGCVCVFARSHKIRSSFAVVRVKYAHFI